ncbi:MAG: TonB family protein [Nannocystaceae bacterium]
MSTTPRAPGRAAEIVVRLGDTVLDVRHLAPGEPTSTTSIVAAIGATCVVLGLVLMIFGAVALGLLGMIAGAVAIAFASAKAPGRAGDRYLVGEAPSVDLPLPVREPEGEAALCRVVGAGVVLGLVDGLDGEIVGAGADGSIEALRSAGWKVTTLPVGAVATLRRGDLSIEIRALAEAPVLRLDRPPIDRGVAAAHLASLGILGGFFVALTAAPPPTIDLHQEYAAARERIVTALAESPPTPPRREAVRELPPPDASPRPSERRSAPKEAPPPASEPLLVEVDGEAVAAPRLRKGPPAFKRRKGGGVTGSAQEEGLAEIAEEWLAIETESMKKYADTKDDRDAWAALTSGPPIARGFGGLELEGKGRPGGGAAEGAGSGADRGTAERKAAPPVSGLRVGAPKVRGALESRHVGEVAQQNRPRLAQCWSDAHARSPALKGSMKLEITVDRRGRVDSVALPAAPGDEKLGRCVAKAVRGWRFDAPSDGGDAVITLPISFG